MALASPCISARDGSTKPMRIHWDETLCTDCLSCVVVCAEHHTGMSAPARAHIHILVDAVSGEHTAQYCRQCQDAPCVAACPVGAFSFDERLAIWRVDEGLCVGCGECVEACPFEAIRVDAVTGLAAKCDLCLGAMHCVEICPAEALQVAR